MIRHETVGPHHHTILLPIRGASVQIGLIVSVGDKGGLALITPTDDVVEQAGRNHARTTGHERGE